MSYVHSALPRTLNGPARPATETALATLKQILLLWSQLDLKGENPNVQVPVKQPKEIASFLEQILPKSRTAQHFSSCPFSSPTTPPDMSYVSLRTADDMSPGGPGPGPLRFGTRAL